MEKSEKPQKPDTDYSPIGRLKEEQVPGREEGKKKGDETGITDDKAAATEKANDPDGLDKAY